MAKTARMTGLALAAGAMVLAGGTAHAKPRLTGEQQLAKMLEGRVAGEPVDCISMPTISSSRIIDKTAIVYDSGSTLYVQRPRTGAESLDEDDVLVTKLTSSQLCSVDTVHLHDRSGGFWRGFVGLDKFVPYRKVKAAEAK
ncbi:hypothetical protein OLX02_04140 [Novosphingobium sp. KCTC 2891]|uniref:hypothetical protein n=1 Tax=Novosphingobium sp. KCTC 2891 TaxID=2989730 RepID=UPI002223B60E|nr:hypothetical protein [Novosphingobium sp. KCTC 2891]MCW1382004.1 hypothetical protein [Novosphingobium sp. KCTC 2891]